MSGHDPHGSHGGIHGHHGRHGAAAASSLPAEHGPVINMTRTPGTAERFPSWSPDGKNIAYLSDGSGEYEICVRPADGTGAEKTITRMGPGFRYRLFWSPDGKKIAFADQAMNINIADVATGQVTRIDKGLSMYEGDLRRFRCARCSRRSAWVTPDGSFY